MNIDIAALRSVERERDISFETVIEGLKHERHHQAIEDTKLTVEDLQELVVKVRRAADQVFQPRAMSARVRSPSTRSSRSGTAGHRG